MNVRNLYSDWALPPPVELDMFEMMKNEDKVQI